MRRSAVVAMVVLALAGCSGSLDARVDADSSQSAEASPRAPEPPADPSPTPTAEQAVEKGVPEQCEAATNTTTSGDPIAAAADSTELPPGVTLQIGTQVIASTDAPGEFEAVARICSDPLSDDEHRAIATAIAKSIFLAGVGDSLASLRVTSWVPDGDSVADSESLRIDDYGVVLWDSETANLDAMWKSRDEA